MSLTLQKPKKFWDRSFLSLISGWSLYQMTIFRVCTVLPFLYALSVFPTMVMSVIPVFLSLSACTVGISSYVHCCTGTISVFVLTFSISSYVHIYLAGIYIFARTVGMFISVRTVGVSICRSLCLCGPQAFFTVSPSFYFPIQRRRFRALTAHT